MFNLYDSWTNIKNIVDNNGAKIQYLECPNLYKISIIHEQNVYITELWIDTSKVSGIDVEQNNIDKQDFEDNYKANADGIYNANGVQNVEHKTLEAATFTKKSYKCNTIDIEASEQEYDLGGIYTEFSIMNTGNADVFIKLNDTNNDEIPLKGGQNIRDIIGSDTFELRKIYYRTTGSGITSQILLFAIKR